MILDIREEKKEDVIGIKFDVSSDTIVDDNEDGYIGFMCGDDSGAMQLCAYKDLDNFILALRKAKEIWGKK